MIFPKFTVKLVFHFILILTLLDKCKGKEIPDLHPLDPLTAEEISIAVKVVEAAKESGALYIYTVIALHEPPKSTLLPYFLSDTTPPADVCPRKAFLVIIEKESDTVWEAVVNLWTKQRESFTLIPNVQPPFTYIFDEKLSKAVKELTRRDPEVQKRCASLGFPNMERIYPSPWTQGYIDDRPDLQGKRFLLYFMFAEKFPGDNINAHPLDFAVLVDLAKREVIGVEDLPTHGDYNFSRNNTGNVALHGDGNYEIEYLGGETFLRKGDKPITSSSPEGPSFTVQGHEVQWQNWKVRIGFNGREGLFLHTVSYNDTGNVRPILYRASLAEIFTPYADARPPYHRKAAFDMGEIGLGYLASEQVLGEHVIGSDVHFLDEVIHTAVGGSRPLKNAISIREEDDGILWRRADVRTGRSITTRSHRLAITFSVTVGHYDFLFSWFFYQDASIQCLVHLTGIPSVNMDALPGILNPHKRYFSEMVAPYVSAQYHQHFFTARVDAEIDGTGNTVVMADVVPLDRSSENPDTQGFTMIRTPLKTAEMAATDVSAKTGRVWVITNPSKINTNSGQNCGYKFMPPNSVSLLMKRDSPVRRKFARFLDFDTWVTKYEEGQLYPAGFYLNDTGVHEWVGRNPDQNLEDKDVVFWHTFGMHHITQVEDWPTMPAVTTGFWLKPNHFFDKNPALDVRPAGESLQ